MARTTAGFRFVKTLNGSPPTMIVARFTPASATAYYDGNVIRVGATGLHHKVAEAGTEVLGVLSQDIAKGTATTDALLYAADTNNVFETKMIYARAVAPRGYQGQNLDIDIGSVYNYRVATAAANNAGGLTGSGQCTIIGAHPDDIDLTSTANLRYWIVFQDRTSQLHNAGKHV